MENKVAEEGKRTSDQMNGEGVPQAEGGETALTRDKIYFHLVKHQYFLPGGLQGHQPIIERHSSTVKGLGGNLPDAGVDALVVTAPAKSGIVEQEGGTSAVVVVEEGAENESKAGGEEE
ncbi:unnamed protein product [Orchesella dallaii]|uniref:Uncharacterized protein n=1 Tax=Orchesella dallaii TaxID=48710 RepID=A0ABP1RH15_9HEXA